MTKQNIKKIACERKKLHFLLKIHNVAFEKSEKGNLKHLLSPHLFFAAFKM